MIFTTVAAAFLAAVTGVTVVRTPGGSEQEVPVEPACACELTVANLTDYDGMMRQMKRYNFGGQFPKGNSSANQASDMMAVILREMRGADFEPANVSFYNVYDVEKAFRPRLDPFLPERYEENLVYTVISFSDFRYENSKSFFFGNATIANNLTSGSDLVVSAIHSAPSKNAISLLNDAFLACGYKDVSYGKWYCDDDEDNYYGEMANVDHWELEDFFGSGMNHPTDEDDWWKAIIWYEEWKRLQNLMVVGGGLDLDVAQTQIWMGDDRVIANPIGGLLMRYALEESDFLAGNYALDASVVGNQLHTAMAMDYGQLMDRNDLIIL